MKYSSEEFSKTSLGITENIGEQDKITTTLAEMVSMFNDTLAEGVAHEESIKQLSEENERLKSANMQLYLKVTANPADDTKKKNSSHTESETMSFDDLFNEKGELK